MACSRTPFSAILSSRPIQCSVIPRRASFFVLIREISVSGSSQHSSHVLIIARPLWSRSSVGLIQGVSSEFNLQHEPQSDCVNAEGMMYVRSFYPQAAFSTGPLGCFQVPHDGCQRHIFR